eukprot:4720031-Pyramimonas_sp.AAC.1
MGVAGDHVGAITDTRRTKAKRKASVWGNQGRGVGFRQHFEEGGDCDDYDVEWYENDQCGYCFVSANRSGHFASISEELD